MDRDSPRLAKTYTLADVARLAGTSPQNARRWFFGYSAPGHHMAPVFGPRDEGTPMLSFLDLIELMVVARYRSGPGRRIPLERLRRAHAFARETLAIDHPFASGKLWVEGAHVLHHFEEANPGPGKLALDVGGHYVLPLAVADARETLDFDSRDGLARRWYPLGREVPVVVEAGLGAGWPVILGSNVRTEVLCDRWKSGESMDDLADDFEIDRRTVEEVLRAAA